MNQAREYAASLWARKDEEIRFHIKFSKGSHVNFTWMLEESFLLSPVLRVIFTISISGGSWKQLSSCWKDQRAMPIEGYTFWPSSHWDQESGANLLPHQIQLKFFSNSSFHLNQALNQTVLVGGQNQSIQWISTPSRFDPMMSLNVGKLETHSIFDASATETCARSRSGSTGSSTTRAPTSPSTALKQASLALLKIRSTSVQRNTMRTLTPLKWDFVTHRSGQY